MRIHNCTLLSIYCYPRSCSMSLGGAQEVFITVRVAASDYFRREEYDVHTTAYISLSQALLGGVIRIAGLHGDINLRIPQVGSRQASSRCP